MANYKRGDVVIVDFGMMAKVRPAVVVSIPKADRNRNMAVVVPMTTEVRGGECEVSFPKPPWLRHDCVVNVLGIAGIDDAKIERRISSFPPNKMTEIDSALRRMLSL